MPPPGAGAENATASSSVSAEIVSSLPAGITVDQDLELQDYVQRVGEKLAAVSERPDLEWHFTIVDTDDVMIAAIALTNDFTLVTRRLPDFARYPELMWLDRQKFSDLVWLHGCTLKNGRLVAITAKRKPR